MSEFLAKNWADRWDEENCRFGLASAGFQNRDKFPGRAAILSLQNSQRTPP
jgi:hypothetical protein